MAEEINLTWSPEALEQLAAIFKHIARDDLQAAERVALKVEELAETLVSLPRSGALFQNMDAQNSASEFTGLENEVVMLFASFTVFAPARSRSFQSGILLGKGYPNSRTCLAVPRLTSLPDMAKGSTVSPEPF